MFSSVTATLGQLTDRQLHKPIIISIFGSIAAVLLFGAAIFHILTWFSIFGGWMDTAASWAASVIVVILGILFLPSASSAISSLFLDSVCNAVETKHYPGLGPPQPQRFVETILENLKFLGLQVLVNIVLLPLYLFAPGLNVILFYAVNGYLLGREFFEMVAMRRLRPAEAKALRKRNAGSVFVSGVLIAGVMTVPVLNCAGPVFATAFMLHRFERLRNTIKK